jgi:hypothetical protein
VVGNEGNSFCEYGKLMSRVNASETAIEGLALGVVRNRNAFHQLSSLLLQRAEKLQFLDWLR